MSFMDRLRGPRRAQPSAEQAAGSITVEGDEPGLMNNAAEGDAEESRRAERSGADSPVDTAAEIVRGERGIPSVNRERSIHARVTNALAIGVMVVLGLGFLTYYYSTTFKRRAVEDQRVKDGAASKAAGEMKLPPLAPIEPPQRNSAPPLAAHVLGPAPDLPKQPQMMALRVKSEAASGLPASGLAHPNGPPGAPQPGPPLPLSAEEIATLRRLNGPVLYRSSAIGGVALGNGASAVMPSQATDGQFSGNMPVLVGSASASGGGAGNSSLGSLLQATPTPAVQAQVLPTKRLLLPKGAFIDCTLETALDSQLPGMTTCITAMDIFGADGQVVLLERGSKLVGETRGEARLGQARVFVLWTEARTPTGVVVQLASPGTDELGRSGLPGYVDTHFWQRFGAAILISVIDGAIQAAVGSQNSSSGGSAVVYNTQGSHDVLTEVLRSTINIPPTVVKNQGERIQVFVARDLDFRPVYALGSRAAQ
jgi:type IV secretion system protein VirB10